MFKRSCLLTVSLFAHLVYPMSDPNFYVHLSAVNPGEQDVTLPVTRLILDYLETLKIMQQDFNDMTLGTQEKPFPLALDTSSLKDFKNTSSIIREAIKAIYTVDKKINIQRIAHKIWEFVSTKKKPYTWLASALRIGNYLGLKPEIMNALKICIKQTPPDKSITTKDGHIAPETVDYAVNGGLKNINTVPNDILIPIKENIIKTTQSSLEFFFKGIFNDSKTKHPKNTYTLDPLFSSDNFSYSKMFSFHNAEAGMTNENWNVRHFLFEHKPEKQRELLIKDTWIINVPRYNTLGECPFQNLVSEVVRAQLNINATNPAFIGDYLSIHNGQDYTCYSNRYQHASGLLIGTSHIALLKENNWITIPNVVQHIDIYTDSKGSRNLLCFIGFGGEKQKLVSFNLDTYGYNILDEIENGYYATAQCITESSYIYTARNDVTNDFRIFIIKLDEKNAQKMGINHPLFKDGLIKQLIAYTSQNDTINVSAINAKNNTDYLCSISLNIKNKKITIKELPLLHQHFKLVTATSLPSHVMNIDLTHPDIKDFVNHTEFYDTGSLYIGGFDTVTKKFTAVKYLDHSMLRIAEKIAGFMDYGIEHLYMLSAITTRVISHDFNEMTPAEKVIFNTLKDEDKKTLLTIMSWKDIHSFYQQPTSELNTTSKDIPIVNSQTSAKKE